MESTVGGIVLGLEGGEKWRADQRLMVCVAKGWGIAW